MENESRSKIVNDVFVYAAVIIALIVFVLAASTSFGIQITGNEIILLTIVLVLLIFRHFTSIEIPGFIKLSKKVEEIKKENEEIKTTLKAIASAKAFATSSVNINWAEQAKEAKEVGSKLPAVKPEQQVEVSRLDFALLENRLEDGQLIPVFAVIRNTLENMLTDILGKKSKLDDHMTLGQLSALALDHDIISRPLYDAITIIRNSADLIIRSNPNEYEISIEEAKSIFDLSRVTITELQNKIRQSKDCD